jgi:hypothetical protein
MENTVIALWAVLYISTLISLWLKKDFNYYTFSIATTFWLFFGVWVAYIVSYIFF